MPTHPFRLDHEAMIDALEERLADTVAIAERTPGDLDIPTCPGWNASALWEHLGAVHRWAAEIVRTRSDVRISRSDLELGLPGDDAWSPWLAEGGDLLLAALRDTAADEAMWVWGADPRAAWWARRQLHETALHNADAALALGESVSLPPVVAADGVDELLENLPTRLAWRGADAEPPPSLSVHLHATDDVEDLGGAGEWTVRLDAQGVTWTHQHSKGDVALRGPLTAILLAAYGRIAPGEAGTELLGDATIWSRFRDILAH